jgi:hypothetical protein
MSMTGVPWIASIGPTHKRKAHSHAAQPDRRDFQIAFSKFALLHI